MTTEIPNTNLRDFIIIWVGQLISIIGSSMTSFATNLWAWELTNQATTLTLTSFFTILPSIFITPISGLIVDRCNRKLLMVLGDTVAVCLTFMILFLYFTNQLEIWHLYVINAIRGTFNQIQALAYSTSVVLMVPKRHYARASSMEFLSGYGADIVAPALAGYLYFVIGLAGMALIDVITFAIAISTVILIRIPQPVTKVKQHLTNIWQEVGFGWRYILARKSLLALAFISLLFWLAHDVGGALYAPMILARSHNNAVLLGSLASAAGIGGVVGALIFSAWGGFKHRIHGVLLGMIGAGLSKMFFGLGNTPSVWMTAQFCSSLNFPLNGSSETAIWLAKVAPNVQGRVFAARSLLLQLGSAVAYLIAGPLADNVFEPAMQSKSNVLFILGRLFGTDTGAGMAVIYTICAFLMLLVGIWGYKLRLLCDVETILPDYDSTANDEYRI